MLLQALFQLFDRVLNDQGTVYIHIPDPDFMEWQYKHRSEVLQVIDQALYLPDMLRDMQGTKLFVHFMETYELFYHGCDYRFMVLKKRVAKSYEEIHNPGVRFHKRMLNRLKLASQVLVRGENPDSK